MIKDNKDLQVAMGKAQTETDGTDSGYTGMDDSGDTSTVQMRNQPKLIISSYTLNPKMVEAGNNFDLALTLYNTNNTNTVYNLKVSIEQNGQGQSSGQGGENNALVSDGSVFSPVNSSNTFYTAAIYPWNYVTKNIKMNVLPNAKAGSYVMGVTLEYEDYLGNQYRTTESIGIPVVQKAQVTSGEINIDEGLAVGTPTAVSMNVYNTGKDNLSTFMMKVVGKGFTVDEDTHFVGNFASGATENYSFNITPTDKGPIEGKVILTYEDSTGKEHKEEKTFKKEVEEEQQGPTLDENGNPIEIDPETGEPITEQAADGPTSFLTSPFTWIGLVVLIVIIILVVSHKKKKKKKEEELTIDED
ncbi:MAG: hypothetical protein PUG67_02935 [Peptoniphilaceae bacterium]|nr:hypothetical protein [Peptoniphilaceae bacterium]MDY6019029.1 hypothetical protein [Anaerococcus sp.]